MSDSESKKKSLIIRIVFALIVILFAWNYDAIMGAFRGDNSSSNGNDTKINYDNIKTLEQLKAYQRDRANSICEDWLKLQKLKNADNKNNQMERLDYLYFSDADNVRNILKLNDLPKEWLYPATDETKKILDACGFEVQKRF